MRGMKEKGGETFPKLKKMLDETTHGSVKLTQVTKEGKEEFRSTYDVIKDLSMVWDDLNNMQKSMIAEKFAGKQNANVFFSLMLNAKKDLESIKETADDSFQSAQLEQEAYMNSLSAKINSLKEDFKGLFLDLGDTNLLKNIIGGVDVGINALRTLIKTFGALPSIVGLASASMVMFNQKTRNALNKNNILFFRDMENGFKRVARQSRVTQIGILRDLAKLKAQFKSGEITNTSYATSLVGIKAKMAAVKLEAIATRVAVTALEGVLSFGIGIGISLVIEGITKLINKLVNAKSELREFNQDIANSFNSNIEDIKKSEGLLDKINNTKIQINNTSDSQKQNELKKQLLDYEKQLADVLPNAATEFDNEGNAIATNTKLIEENIRQKKQQAKDEVGSFIEKNKKFKEHVDEYIKDQKRLQENQLKLRQIEESNKNKKWYERTENTTALEKDIKKAKEDIKDYSAEINNLIKMKKGLESAGVSKSDIGNIIGQDNLDALDQYNQYLQQTQSSADNAKPSIDNLAEGIENTGYDAKEAEKELKALSDAFSGLRGEVDVLDKAMEEFKKNGQLSANIVEKIFASGDPRLISLLADQNHFMENSIALEKQLKEERESAYTQEIEQAQYMVQNGIQAENDKTQVAASGSNDRINITNNETAQKSNMYSNDTVNHANSEDTKVANAQSGADTRTEASSQETNNKAEHYKTDSSNHANLVDTKNKAAIDGANTIQTANSSMINNMGDAYKRDVDNFDNACQTKALSAMQLTKKLHDMMAQVGLGLNASGLPNQFDPKQPSVPLKPGYEWKWDGAQWSAWTKHSINPVKVANNPVQVDYSPEANGHGHKGSGSKGNKGKGSKNGEHVDIKDIEDKIDAYKSLQDAIDDVNNELEITKTLEENAQGANKLQYMNKEINLYKQKKDAINNLIAAKQNEGRYLEGVLKSNGFNASNGNISNYYDRLKQIEDEVNAMDNSNKAKEQAIKNFKDLKEKADKYFEITSKELPKLNNEWYALAKTIKEVSEKQVKLMGDTEREMTNVVKNQVEERKKALEDETSKIKEELKKQRDEYNKKYDDENFEKNLKEKQDKLNKLNAQIDSVRRDISSEGQSKLKDLLKQKDDLEKELNNFIRDRQKDQGNKAFDEQMDKIDKHKDEKIKEMEKTYTDEKIAELAKGMIQKGFVEIEGHVIKLRDALNDYYKKNGEVFADSSLKMQEYIDNLELTKKLYGELTSINNNLGVSSSNIRYNSGNNVVQAIPKVASFMAIPQGSKKANIKIESNLHIGSVHEGTTEDIKSMLDERDRKIINEINEQLNSY